MSTGYADSSSSARALQILSQLSLLKLGRRLTTTSVVVGLLTSLPATSSAQIPGHRAVNTASYDVVGRASTFATQETPNSRFGDFSGADLKQTFSTIIVDPDDEETDYIRFPVSIRTALSNTAMSGVSKAEGSVNVEATADTGALRVSVEGFMRASSSANSGTATAELNRAIGQARWQDVGRFTRPLDPQPGRLVKLESFMDLSGGIGNTISGQAPFSSDLRLAASSVTLVVTAGREGLALDPLPPGGISARGQASTAVTVPRIEPAPSMFPVTLFVTENVLFSIDFTMTVRAAGRTTNNRHFAHLGPDGNLFETTFIGAYGSTLKWGGISRVTDAVTGAPIEGWSITSASGFNYANAYQEAVPEPASIGLALMGLAGIVCLTTRSH